MSPSSTARGGIPRARFLPGEAVHHPHLGRGLVIRDDETGIEVQFVDPARRTLVQRADGIRRIAPDVEGRVSPSWMELDAPGRFVPPLLPAERSLIEALDAYAPPEWEVYVRPHLDGDLPSVAMLHRRAGVVLIDVVEAPSVDHPALYRSRGAQRKFVPALVLERVRRRLYGTTLPELAEAIDLDRRRFGLVRLALMFPRLKRHDVAQWAALYPFVCFIAGSDPRPDDIRALLPRDRPDEGWLTDQQYQSLRDAFRHHYSSPDFLESVDLKGRQRELATPKDGLQLITGVAGSGKTMILCHRAARIASSGRNVLILTFNRTLANYVKGLLTTVPVSYRSDRITVLHFHGLCALLMDESAKRQLAQSAQEGPEDTTPEAQSVSDQQEMAPPQEWFDETWPELTLEAIGAGVSERFKYDAILIDEAQDLSEGFLLVLLRLLNPQRHELVAVMDRAQVIYGREPAFVQPSVLKAFGRPSHLSVGYRLSPQAARAANRFIDRWGLATPHIEVPEEGLGLTATQVAWASVRSDAEAAAAALSVVEGWIAAGRASRDIAVLVPSADFGAAFVQLLADHRIGANHIFPVVASGAPMDGSHEVDEQLGWVDFTRSMKEAFAYGDARLKVSTIHSYKGWECRSLVVVLPHIVALDQVLVSTIYVALTRTRGDLVVIGKDDVLGFEEIAEALINPPQSPAIEDRFASLLEAVRALPRPRRRPASSTQRIDDGPPESDWSFLEPVPGDPVSVDTDQQIPDLEKVVVAVMRCIREPVTLARLTHLLRDSQGPATRDLVARFHPPHVGHLAHLDFRTAADEIEAAIAASEQVHLVTVDDAEAGRSVKRVVLSGPPTDGAAERTGPATARRNGRWTPEQDEVVTQMWAGGHTLDEISDRLLRTGPSVSARMVRLGLVRSREEARAQRVGGSRS